MHSFYQISWVTIIRGGNWLGENFSRREVAEWELSGWEFSWGGVVRVGVFLGGNCPGGTNPGWEFSFVEVFPMGIVRWESSGSQFSGLNNFVFHVRQIFKMQWLVSGTIIVILTYLNIPLNIILLHTRFFLQEKFL